MAIGLGAYSAHETHFRTFSVRESLTHCYISEQTPLAAPPGALCKKRRRAALHRDYLSVETGQDEQSAGKKKPPGDGGKQKITCMNSLNNVSESNFAASRPEKQFTRDAVRRSLTR